MNPVRVMVPQMVQRILSRRISHARIRYAVQTME